jgi:hypothetical protein
LNVDAEGLSLWWFEMLKGLWSSLKIKISIKVLIQSKYRVMLNIANVFITKPITNDVDPICNILSVLGFSLSDKSSIPLNIKHRNQFLFKTRMDLYLSDAEI